MPIWWFWWIITSSESIVGCWKDLESVLLLCVIHFPCFCLCAILKALDPGRDQKLKAIRPCLWGMNIHCTTYFVLRGTGFWHPVAWSADYWQPIAEIESVCSMWGRWKKTICIVSLATGDLAKSLDYFIVNVPLSKSLQFLGNHGTWPQIGNRELQS